MFEVIHPHGTKTFQMIGGQILSLIMRLKAGPLPMATVAQSDLGRGLNEAGMLSAGLRYFDLHKVPKKVNKGVG